MCSTRERERHKSVGMCDLFFCPIKSNKKCVVSLLFIIIKKVCVCV